MSEKHLEFPVLIGDIGGTNARFSLIENKDSEEQIFPTKTVADFSNIDEAIEQGILPLTKLKPKSIMLAMAGPVEGNEIPLTNSQWVIRPHQLMSKLQFSNVFVINDFEAQALATTALPPEYLQEIGNLNTTPMGTRVVLGPGTGLGVAGLIHLDGRYIPVAGEGGHVDYAPQSERDFELLPFLHKIQGRISAEEILSGRGIVSIYRAVCAADGVKPVFETPNAITVAAYDESETQVHEAVQFFICYLARLAGDFALTFKAQGGIFIGGGIMPKILQLINHHAFRNAFENKAPHQKLLGTMPTFIMTHPRAALIGMNAYVSNPTHYILDKNKRFW